MLWGLERRRIMADCSDGFGFRVWSLQGLGFNAFRGFGVWSLHGFRLRVSTLGAKGLGFSISRVSDLELGLARISGLGRGAWSVKGLWFSASRFQRLGF